MNDLHAYTIAEIVLHLEQRAFPNIHTLDTTSRNEWHLERPLRCRIMQYDEAFDTMHTLRDTCAVNHAMENGLATAILERNGPGRHELTPETLNQILEEKQQTSPPNDPKEQDTHQKVNP